MTADVFASANLLQVQAPIISFDNGLTIVLFLASIVISIISSSSKKISSSIEARIAGCEMFQQNQAVKKDDLTRLKEDVAKALEKTEELSDELEKQSRENERQLYKSDKETTQKLNEISNLLARIHPK